MGGIAVDAWGRSSLPGLWACGEVAATGVHGANRLASNSLLEGLVFAGRIARDIAGMSVASLSLREIEHSAASYDAPTLAPEAVARLRRVMDEHVGVVRDGEGLRGVLDEIDAIVHVQPSLASANRVVVSRAIAQAALARCETRGSHARRDFPSSREEYEHRSFITPREEAQAPVWPVASSNVAGAPAELPMLVVEPIVRAALHEDLGRAGDITTHAVISADARASATVVARREGRVAGLGVAACAFALVDAEIVFETLHPDGSDVGAGQILAIVRGRARSLLTGERTALNFLGHLSGIATATRELVERVRGTRARIADTRKTTPGLRVLEKYAVRVGGGVNHRFGLDDAVLIKDNHIAAAGGIAAAVERARASVGHMVKVEVEVETLVQLEEALRCGVDAVLLDNMAPEQLAEAVKRVGGRCVTEASGSITAQSVAAVAA